MISYIQIENLTKSFGDRLLYSDITFGIYQGDKIGIIATNGTGKTTFLNIITGKEDYDSGRIVKKSDLRIGYLPQNPEFNPDLRVKEYISSCDKENFETEDSAVKYLTMFGIPDLNKKMGEMSGGEIKRVVLAKILAESPDLLILDEPTNHLDIEMVEWLEGYLSKKNLTLLMVTHDRYFLDKVCNKILEIDRQEFHFYEGNYDYYLKKRDERYEALNAELLKVKNLLRSELEWMRRQPQARGSKAKYRIDQFYELEAKSHFNLNSRQIEMGKGGGYIGNKIFEARNINKSFGNKKILENFNYTFARHEKVGIVGANGVGKSTFIKILLGEIEPDNGSFDVGITVRWGHFSQEGFPQLEEGKKVIDVMRDIAEEVRIDEKTRLTASQFLSRFLFSPDTQQKYVSKLSGGERRRLYLATVLFRNPNFLILDEPTNDLDIMTLAVLEDYLVNFRGCVIVVSHDRYFLDRIVDHLFVFEGEGKVKDFPGNYSDYRSFLKAREEASRESQNSDNTSPKKIEREPKERARKLSYKEKKELENLEALLPELEKEKRQIEEKMSSGEMSPEELMKAAQRIEELISEIDEKEMRLLELMEIQEG